MVDLPNDAEILGIFIHVPDRKLLLTSSAGDGFVVPENEVVAQTRSGKQVINVHGLSNDTKAKCCKVVEGDHVAFCYPSLNLGSLEKTANWLYLYIALLSFLSSLNLPYFWGIMPWLTFKSKGVRLQKYKDGGLSDVIFRPLT